MRSSEPAVRLGGADLGTHRHICALFEGPKDAANVLMPFELDGLERGDRVIHVVKDARTYLRRFGKRLEISTAVTSRQLDIRGWDASYLTAGRFSASRMLTYIRRSLREGPILGFKATRLIGDMEWATDDLPGVDELAAYERGVSPILARPHTVVICAYDVRRHSGSRIAEILAAHEAVLVGGTLQPMTRAGDGASARARILAAAAVLFAENGIQRTGVDALIEAAGVAKATFYRHFPTKDAVVVAWLQDPRARWFDRVRAQAEARASTPVEVIQCFFEAVAEWLETDDFLGCPFLNTSTEIADPDHAAAIEIREHLAEIGAWLTQQAAASGHPDPVRVGTALHALVAGSISLGVANRTAAYALAARDAAMQLLGSKRPGEAGTRGGRN